jgi:hypothetical protein
LYKRWGRIRTLSGSFEQPWDNAQFDDIWGKWQDGTKHGEYNDQAMNLYKTIPNNAFDDLVGNRKNVLTTVASEYESKMAKINEMAVAYTKMLDVVFAKRRKMSENLMETTERFMYWKDKPAANANDKTVDYKNIEPTLAKLTEKRQRLAASNAAPQLNLNASVITNNKAYTSVQLSWTGTHPDGIAEYSVEQVLREVVGSQSVETVSPFKSIGKAASWNPLYFPVRQGESDKQAILNIRARSGSGFFITKRVDVWRLPLGFSDATMNTGAQTVTNSAPVDDTPPVMIKRFANGNTGGGLWAIDINQTVSQYLRFPVIKQTDQYISGNTKEVKIQCTAEDPESGINSFEYRIIKRNLTDSLETVRDWTNIGAVNEYLIQGLNLQHCVRFVSPTQFKAAINERNFNRYVFSVRAINGAGLKSYARDFAVIIDTTTPAPVVFQATTVPTTVYAPTNQQYLIFQDKAAIPLPAFTPLTQSRQIIFGWINQPEDVREYIYKVYKMPGDIPVTQEWVRDNSTLAELRGGTVVQGKIVDIPAQFADGEGYRIELAYTNNSGSTSAIATSSEYFANSYKGSAPDVTYEVAIPVLNWFEGVPPGYQGTLPNGNINLYFKNLAAHRSGIRKYMYLIAAGNNYTAWKDMPSIPADRIMRLGPEFFSGTENWLTPGTTFNIEIKALSGNYVESRYVTVRDMVMPNKPPLAENFSVDFEKKTIGGSPKFTPSVSFAPQRVVSGQRLYFVRTEVFKNGNWVSPEAPLSGASKNFMTLAQGQGGNNSTTSVNLITGTLTPNMMPARGLTASGTTYQSQNEIWRIYLKVKDNNGNESPEAVKEFIW